MISATQQLHTGKRSARQAGCLTKPALRYAALVSAIAFGDVRRVWQQPASTRRPEASDAVSNPTTRSRQTGVNQARLHQEVEKGSFPFHTAERQAARPIALILNNDRVVSETNRGSMSRRTTRSTISDFLHAASAQCAGSTCRVQAAVLPAF